MWHAHGRALICSAIARLSGMAVHKHVASNTDGTAAEAELNSRDGVMARGGTSTFPQARHWPYKPTAGRPEAVADNRPLRK